MHVERKLQDSVKFQLETLSLFSASEAQLELVLKLFLIFGQTEPHCCYKVVLIKKACSGEFKTTEVQLFILI